MNANLTNVVGYFNPHEWPISLEISELNLRLVLNPKQYVTDAQGNYFNDPIFNDYVSPKGLSRTESRAPVPIRYVPRMVRTTRPAHAVTQANSFVRDSQGNTVPVYSQPPQVVSPESPVNKNPVMGMTVETARRLGYAGKPRLISEDYGLPDGQGAPPDKNLPPIKVSIESPPRIRTAAPLTPQVAEALNDPSLSPQERQARAHLQQQMSRSAASASGEDFRPETVRPGNMPMPLRAPDEPSLIVGGSVLETTPPISVQPQAVRPVKKGKRKVAQVVTPAAPPASAMVESESPSPIQGATSMDSAMPDPALENPPSTEEPGKRFVCGADGKAFQYRSELYRYAKSKYPHMLEDLMQPYPPDPESK